MKKLIAVIAAIVTAIGIFAGAAFAEKAVVSREEAIQAALDYTSLKKEQVTFTKVRKDWDDGRRVWEIEFLFNGIEYEFDVDASTSRVIKADRDLEDRDDWDDWFDFD